MTGLDGERRQQQVGWEPDRGGKVEMTAERIRQHRRTALNRHLAPEWFENPARRLEIAAAHQSDRELEPVVRGHLAQPANQIILERTIPAAGPAQKLGHGHPLGQIGADLRFPDRDREGQVLLPLQRLGEIAGHRLDDRVLHRKPCRFGFEEEGARFGGEPRGRPVAPAPETDGPVVPLAPDQNADGLDDVGLEFERVAGLGTGLLAGPVERHQRQRHTRHLLAAVIRVDPEFVGVALEQRYRRVAEIHHQPRLCRIDIGRHLEHQPGGIGHHSGHGGHPRTERRPDRNREANRVAITRTGDVEPERGTVAGAGLEIEAHLAAAPRLERC